MNKEKSKTIRKILIDKDVTMTAIAESLNVTFNAVHRVINGQSKSKRIAAKIKEITGVEL